MGEISIGRALGAGFSLIRRHVGAFIVWIGVYILVGVLPQFGIMALMIPNYEKLVQGVGAGPGHTLDPQLMQTQMQMAQIGPLSWLASIVVQTLLLSAAYRAVLFPQDKAFFYLRLGVRELWLALVCFVLLIGFVVVMFLVMFPVALLGGILAAVGGPAAGALLSFATITVGFAVMIWLALRMSLAPPMTFAERNFRLFESWQATRGHAGKMFGVAAVIVAMLFAVEIAVMLIALSAAGGPTALASLFKTGANPAEIMARMLPIAAVAGLVLSPLAVAFYALFGGAWAQMYRDLFPAPEEVFS